MAIIVTYSETIEKIIKGLEALTEQEQGAILAQINATIMLKKGLPKISKTPKGLKPLSMAQIDSIKHKVRKQYAK
jgi:hypothetical protein